MRALRDTLPAGPVEEFSKLLGLVIVYQIIKKQFNEITDGVIYISCVALGFSIIENFFYANLGDNNEHLLIFGALISTPAHISCSCLNDPDRNIEDLPIPFCAVATDILNGSEKTFTDGNFYDAIRASISIPTVFQPFKIGNSYYVG